MKSPRNRHFEPAPSILQPRRNRGMGRKNPICLISITISLARTKAEKETFQWVLRLSLYFLFFTGRPSFSTPSGPLFHSRARSKLLHPTLPLPAQLPETMTDGILPPLPSPFPRALPPPTHDFRSKERARGTLITDLPG